MLLKNNIAFKEWAVVCAALGSGRQTILVRKGGIDEGREGFRIKYGEFWLLPTRFHQDPSQLTSDAQPLWQQLQQHAPPPNKFSVDLYAVVEHIYELHDENSLNQLTAFHILSAETIRQRFHYRHPGLIVLAVRVYRMPTAFEAVDSPYIAGCKSWVELPKPLSTAGAIPVIDNAAFMLHLNQLKSRIG